MKKTKILSLLTAAAITVSSVATYAVWDTVSATSDSQTVTLRNPVTVVSTSNSGAITADANTLNPGSITASGTVTFNVENKDSVAKKLTLSESITAQEALVENTDYSIQFTGTDVSGKTDSSVTDGEETYDYTITFTEEGLNKLKSNSNQCTLEVTATLS